MKSVQWFCSFFVIKQSTNCKSVPMMALEEKSGNHQWALSDACAQLFPVYNRRSCRFRSQRPCCVSSKYTLVHLCTQGLVSLKMSCVQMHCWCISWSDCTIEQHRPGQKLMAQCCSCYLKKLLTIIQIVRCTNNAHTLCLLQSDAWIERQFWILYAHCSNVITVNIIRH